VAAEGPDAILKDDNPSQRKSNLGRERHKNMSLCMFSLFYVFPMASLFPIILSLACFFLLGCPGCVVGRSEHNAGPI